MTSGVSRRSTASLLVLGLLVREVFSFWTGHEFDFEIWVRDAFWVARGSSPYLPLPPAPGLSFAFLSTPLPPVAYLPLWPLLLAGLYRVYALLGDPGRFVLYFLLKQPVVFGDVLLGYTIFRAVATWGGTETQARGALRFWMLFPFAILISAVWGMFDALAAVAWLASLLVATSWRRSGLLGLAILAKSLPLVAIPYELLRLRGRSRLAVVLAVAVPALFTLVALALTGWGTEGLMGVLSWDIHGSLLQGLTYESALGSPYILPLMPGLPILILALGYVWIPATIVASVWAWKRLPEDAPSTDVQAVLLVLVVLFLTRWTVNPQYLILFLPFLLLDVVLWHPERRPLFHVLWVLALTFIVFLDSFLLFFLTPASPSAQEWLAALDGNAVYEAVVTPVTLVLGGLFSVHLVQLGALILRPGTDPDPWILRPFRLRPSGRVLKADRAQGPR